MTPGQVTCVEDLGLTRSQPVEQELLEGNPGQGDCDISKALQRLPSSDCDVQVRERDDVTSARPLPEQSQHRAGRRRRNNLNRPGLSPEDKVGIALWRLSSKKRCPLLHQKFRVGRNVVNRCLKEVCQAIITILKPIYLHPPDYQSLKDTARIFNARWGFPHCVGALGSFPIPLSSNSTKDGTHALVLHAVVDGQGLLWEACACYPENMSSAAILENFALWELAQERRLQTSPKDYFLGKAHNYFLLANSNYPLQSWLLTPYTKIAKLSQREKQYNLHLERALSVAEIALLRLRARWQCLLAPSGCKIVPTVALACCVLHNMCETLEQRFDSRWLEGVQTMDLPVLPNFLCQSCPTDLQAASIRDAICEYFNSQTKM
ncbi:unnamed protein product [Ranitomeya imitator]|uniref:DDE Tnp4 domain-containing protein n=1 Tax=Ranitomeya imitator TaxID=111125 RepID=A0ABN9M2S5_9NEOB|nr:unnamed protein product [Ranitomeya imitator]